MAIVMVDARDPMFPKTPRRSRNALAGRPVPPTSPVSFPEGAGAPGYPARPLLALVAFSVLALTTFGSVSWCETSALYAVAAPVAVAFLALYFAAIRLKHRS